MDIMLKFVGEGGSKLPPGFRFEPTDEEIVFQYLARKTFSHPLPGPIPEINIFTSDPWELFPGKSEQEMYFFSNKEAGSCNYRNGAVQTSIANCTGYWKVMTGSAKRIICSKRQMPIIGIRKTLVFYKRSKNRAFRTDWIMHENFIAISQNYSIHHKNNSHHQGGSLVRIGNWTLCRIIFKRRRKNAAIAAAEDHDESDYKHRNIDLMAADVMSDTDSSSASSSN